MSIFTRIVNWFLPKKTILFVCTGNTCRSPMAAAIANKLLKGTRYRAASAGISALDGDRASDNAVAVMREMGIDISSHRARHLTPRIAQDAHWVYGLTANHAYNVKNLADIEHVLPLGPEISDPYGGDIDRYRACAEQICNRLIWIVENEIPRI